MTPSKLVSLLFRYWSLKYAGAAVAERNRPRIEDVVLARAGKARPGGRDAREDDSPVVLLLVADPFGDVGFEVAIRRMGAEHHERRAIVIGVKSDAVAVIGLEAHLESGRDLDRVTEAGIG